MGWKIEEIVIGFDLALFSFQVALKPEGEQKPKMIGVHKDFDKAKEQAVELAKKNKCKITCHTAKKFELEDFSGIMA